MSIKLKLQIAALGALLLGASSAIAQPAPSPLPTLQSAGLACDDFAPIGNGLWKPTHPFDLTVGSSKQTLSPLNAFGPSDKILGLPLALMLKAECLK